MNSPHEENNMNIFITLHAVFQIPAVIQVVTKIMLQSPT